jgi:hypothetical protein
MKKNWERFAKMFDHKQAIGDGPVYTTIKIAGFLNFNPHWMLMYLFQFFLISPVSNQTWVLCFPYFMDNSNI